MSLDVLDLFGSNPTVTGTTRVTVGERWRALLKSQYYSRGEIVEVVYAGRDKVTVRASKAQVSMLPADFLNNFEKVELSTKSEGNSIEDEGGVEIPGMVAVYLVRLLDGMYYVDEPKDGRDYPQVTQYWHAAKFMFLMNGALKAKHIAERWGGQVCIVNCTKVQPYRGL